MMPGLDGPEICRLVRHEGQAPYVYMILLTVRNGKCDIVSGIESGADDYVSKPFDNLELRARVRAGRRIVELHEALRFQVSHDILTGLLSRGAVLDDLQRELSRSSRPGTPVGVLIVDIDHFKQLNDTFGHLAGDAALREVAQRMVAVLRPHDALGRYGGDEFLAVLSNCGRDEARDASERLRRAVAATPLMIPAGETSLTVSIGGVAALGASIHHDTLIHAADVSLYRAKCGGRNHVEIA